MTLLLCLLISHKLGVGMIASHVDILLANHKLGGVARRHTLLELMGETSASAEVNFQFL